MDLGLEFRESDGCDGCAGRFHRGCDTCVSNYLRNPCVWVITLGVVSILTVIPFIYLTAFDCDKVIYINEWNQCSRAFTPILIIASVWISFGVVMGISYCCRHCRGWVNSVNSANRDQRSGYNEVPSTGEEQSLIQ